MPNANDVRMGSGSRPLRRQKRSGLIVRSGFALRVGEYLRGRKGMARFSSEVEAGGTKSTVPALIVLSVRGGIQSQVER
jgi:hypothetical protein